jgi:hemophore-related protein
MHVRSLVAGIGIAAVAVTVPLVVVSAASAQDSPPPSSTATPDCPRQDLRTEVKGYLTAHPDVKQEIADLKKLPKDQRAQARQQYLAAHPDVAAQLEQFRHDRRGTWAEVAGGRTAELNKYPAVQALLQDRATIPAGQRAAEAKTYLAAHPDARTQLDELRSDARAHRQTCRAGK